jgi:hypothetical protein
MIPSSAPTRRIPTRFASGPAPAWQPCPEPAHDAPALPAFLDVFAQAPARQPAAVPRPGFEPAAPVTAGESAGLLLRRPREKRDLRCPCLLPRTAFCLSDQRRPWRRVGHVYVQREGRKGGKGKGVRTKEEVEKDQPSQFSVFSHIFLPSLSSLSVSGLVSPPASLLFLQHDGSEGYPVRFWRAGLGAV